MDGIEDDLDDYADGPVYGGGYEDTGADMNGGEDFGDYGDADVFEDTLAAQQTETSFNQTMPAASQSQTGGVQKDVTQPIHSEDWSKHSIRPESTDRWQEKTLDNLNMAKALSRHAHKNMMDNAMAQTDGARRHNNSTANVQNMIKKKMGITSDLIKALEDRIESIEDTVRQVGESLFSLQRAHRSKWAPLNVCERRLELRDQRPLPELIRDACQEAMEHERQTLIEARQELADQIDASKEMLMNLENAKSSLVQDLQNKRHSMRIDRSCLSPGKLKSGVPQSRLVLPSLQDVPNYGQPPSPKNAAKMSGSLQEESRQMDARQLIQAAIHLEEDAMRLCNASDAAMIHTKKETTRASNAALAALALRVDETDELKKKLASQLRETDETIVQTEISLQKTKKKLDSHEVPLNALDKQFAMRNRRSAPESIRDAVHEELESHLDSVKKSVKALTNKFQSTKDVLEQLRSSKSRMAEDHRSKLAALKIDDACLKVTPRKAIELDRMDPRGGRCMKPAGGGRRPQQQSMGYTY